MGVLSNQLLSKIATSNRHGEDSPYFDGWKAYDNDPYHPQENPHGVIQMGLAENQLSLDLIEEWIKNNPQASICTKEGVHKFKDIAIYQDYHGLPKFRKGIANFMGKVRGGKVSFDPNRIVMSGGATGANELLMFCLANPGDAFLVPSPYYPAFDRDLRWRTGVQILPVDCNSSNNFQLTKEALEEAYEKAARLNINVKGVIISNPSNPLGTIIERASLKTLVNFVNGKSIHLVCDEIYAGTIFRSPEFVSIAEIIEEMDCNRDLIHIVYSLSKDMGFPGFRVGVVYSYNDDVVSCGRKMSSFGLVSSETQHLLSFMLSDDDFVVNFLKESSRRLAQRHFKLTKGLSEVGITCLNSNSGLFVWMDLRKLLKDQTFEAEMELWRLIINEVKLNVSPGSSFHCLEPGWFRVCFANIDNDTVDVTLQRIRAFVGQRKEEEEEKERPPLETTKRGRRNLSVSFSSRRFEESVMSPHIMSPHSPYPLSPLVRART